MLGGGGGEPKWNVTGTSLFVPNEKLANDEDKLGGFMEENAAEALAADFSAARAKNSARVAARAAAETLFTSLFSSDSVNEMVAGLGGGRGGVAEKIGGLGAG